MSPFASVYGCVLVTTSAARQTPGGPGPLNQGLDDNDKTFGPDLPLLFKMHEIWWVIRRKIINIVATRCQILTVA